ncbi:BamA/TamA family outer membrane protein [Mucilaginibacter sp. UYCu711]|uniref:BamA/TamA family outer membrane protein n=1 Tax=Mucilaginibacter sp. UYCu711 TaxID=3156339 RepID=UPI003D1FB390
MYNNRIVKLNIFLFVCVFFSVTALAQNGADSIKIAAHPKYNHVSPARRLFFGQNYRKVWGLPVNLKVLHLATEKGGLKVTEKGGGNQTRSLHLIDSAGNKYALRSVEKYPERALPKDERHTAKNDILKDAVTTSNPYSALIVPPLTEALGIPHSNPQIVYVGDDEALGEYRKDFAKQVYLFEQTEKADSKLTKTEKVKAKLLEDNDNKIDQKLLLRARLLDIIMGDWDRHADQWRWQKTDLEKGNLYVPVPQDRDKVFYSTSGIFPWFAANQKPQLQAYHARIKHIAEWNLNNVFFDLQYLNRLNQADWEEQIAYVQNKLTDQILARAVKLMPVKVYSLVGKKNTATLIARRNNLKESGLDYYRFLAKNVDIPASDKRDDFEIKKQSNGVIDVAVYKLKKDDTRGDTIYKRTFDPEVTKEIRLYGMDGKDRFTVSGASSPIQIRMVGGKDEDSFVVDNASVNNDKLFIYDTSDDKNSMPAIKGAHIELSKDTNINRYEKEGFKYDLQLPKFGLGYNTEDGVRLQVGYGIEKHGFRDEPYKSKQDLSIGYTLSKGSFIFTYLGDFKHVAGKNSLLVNIISRGPRNVNSFFGYGNETFFPNAGTKVFNYYRNRYDYTIADVRIYQQLNKWRISEGLVGQYYTSKAADNTDLFFNEYNQTHPAENLFATKTYGGAVLGVEFDTRNSTAYPTKGVLFSTRILGLSGINLSGHKNAQLFSTFTFFLNPRNDSTFVIADRIGGGAFAGNGEFFQMMNLGGPFSLQGFHTSRFIGKQMLFNDLELRLKLFKFNTYLFPGTLGLIAFNDAGRVWLPGETSDTIHDTYGGGLFITPYSKFILSAVLGHAPAPDGTLLYLNAGFRF